MNRQPAISGANCAAVLLVAIGLTVLPLEAKMSAGDVSAIVDQSRVLGADTEVRAEILEGEHEAVITTNHNPKATDRDCKIDAALIARKIMDAYPQDIARVKVIFYDRDNSNRFRQVTVREKDVKAFAQHQINQDKLLADIELTAGRANPVERFRGHSYSQISQSLEVLPGAFQGARMQLLGKISTLKEKGVSVSPYLVQFFQIEDNVRQGKNDSLEKSIQGLNEKVDQVLEEYKSRQESSRGSEIGEQVKN